MVHTLLRDCHPEPVELTVILSLSKDNPNHFLPILQMNRFTLQPYGGPRTRHTCPHCNHRFKTFKHYIDLETNLPLADHVGRCDRQEQCGYHYTPSQYFRANPGIRLPDKSFNPPPPAPKPFSTIPQHLVDDTLRGYERNNFTLFLVRLFGQEKATELTERYRIGTAKRWPQSTIFWQIDADDRVRTGKIMLYDAATCRRVKEPYSHITWVHRVLNTGSMIGADDSYQLRQCLFGEHLLKLDPFKTVAIAESEKTAIIASRYLHNYIWLAAGSVEGLSVSKCRPLRGRNVILFPDINGYDKWQKKARELNAKMPDTSFLVDQFLLENIRPGDQERGIDIADKFIDSKLLEWELERG